jgi:hypothetical protein
MMLATLHGNRNLGCNNCKGNCTDCKSLSVLSGFCEHNAETLGRAWYERAVSAVVDTASNIGDAVLTPVKAAGSTISDLASGDFGDALHDASRTVTSTVLAPVNTYLAEGSNIPGLSTAYNTATGLEERHPEAIALASIAAAATVISMGSLGPAIMAQFGITPAMVTAVEAGTATAATVLSVGKALLASGQLPANQAAAVQQSVTDLQATQKSSSWYLLAIPALLHFL